MLRITPHQVTHAMRALFRTDEMVVSRCFAVLDGSVGRGTILVDDPQAPTWAAVQEDVDHDLFLGGRLDKATCFQIFAFLRRESDVLVGLPLDDPRLGWLPPDPAYDGRVLEFYDRPPGEGLDRYVRSVPPGCTLERLDRQTILRTEWGPADVAFYGGLDAWEKVCFGYGLLCGADVLSEATVGPPGLGLYEPGVFTRKDQRGKGYGTLVAARLIQEIEAMGLRTFWNCNTENLASTAMARKLGYRREGEFRCLMWQKTG